MWPLFLRSWVLLWEEFAATFHTHALERSLKWVLIIKLGLTREKKEKNVFLHSGNPTNQGIIVSEAGRKDIKNHSSSSSSNANWGNHSFETLWRNILGSFGEEKLTKLSGILIYFTGAILKQPKCLGQFECQGQAERFCVFDLILLSTEVGTRGINLRATGVGKLYLHIFLKTLVH